MWGFHGLVRAQPAHGNAFFCCRGGRVLARSVRNFALFARRSVSPSAVLLSARVPRSVLQQIVFKHTSCSPSAFRVTTHKRGHIVMCPLIPANLSVRPNFA